MQSPCFELQLQTHSKIVVSHNHHQPHRLHRSTQSGSTLHHGTTPHAAQPGDFGVEPAPQCGFGRIFGWVELLVDVVGNILKIHLSFLDVSTWNDLVYLYQVLCISNMIIIISTGACGPVQLASLPNLRGLNTLKTSPCCRREEAHPACKNPAEVVWVVLRASLAVASCTKKKHGQVRLV